MVSLTSSLFTRGRKVVGENISLKLENLSHISQGISTTEHNHTQTLRPSVKREKKG